MSTKALREALDFIQARHPKLFEEARAELAAIEQAVKDHRKAVLSEVREKFAKHADELRRQGEDDAAEIVNDLHDWTYEWETK